MGELLQLTMITQLRGYRRGIAGRGLHKRVSMIHLDTHPKGELGTFGLSAG